MRPRHWGALFLLGALWGSSYLWIKIGVQEIGPFTLVAFRLLVGAAALGLVLVVRRQALPRRWENWAPLAVMGITNTALPFVLISWGEQTVDSAVASVLTGAVPLFVLIMSHFLVRDERITLPRLAGLLLGFGGVVLLAVRGTGAAAALEGGPKLAAVASPGGVVSTLGIVALVAATISYAWSAIYARRALRGVSPLVAAFIPLLFADAAAWLGAAALESPIHVPQVQLTWIAVIWLGVFGSCAAYLVYFYLIGNVGPTRTALVAYLIALIGVALGVMVLGERLDWRLVVGAVLVLSGIAVVSRFPAGKSTGPAKPTASAIAEP